MPLKTNQTGAFLSRSGSSDKLYHYVLTACNASFFDALIVLIESLYRNSFKKFDQIHVYDIGLTEGQLNELAAIPRVNIIDLPYREKTHGYIKSYAFKIDMMHLAQYHIQTNLDKTLLLYLDAGVLVNKSLDGIWKIIQRDDFYIADLSDRIAWNKSGDNIRLFNHCPDNVADELKIPFSVLAQPLLRPGIFGFRLNSAFYKDVIIQAFDLARARPDLIDGPKFCGIPATERSDRIQQLIQYLDDNGIDRCNDNFNGYRHDQFLFSWLIHSQGYYYQRSTDMVLDVTDTSASKRTHDGVFHQPFSLDELLSKRHKETFLIHRNGVRRDFQPIWTRMKVEVSPVLTESSEDLQHMACLKSGCTPTPMAQRLTGKIVIIGQVDYHIRTAASFARELYVRGHHSVILDNSGFVEGGRRKFSEAEMHLIRDTEYIRVGKGPYEVDWLSTAKLVIVFHDWNKDFSDALDYRHDLGLPVVGVVEGINDFLRVDCTYQTSLPYRKCDYVFLAGEHDRKFFGRKTMLGGMPIIEKLSQKVPVFPQKPLAVLNVNFTYGVFEDARDQFIVKARTAFSAAGFDWKITQHPADKGDLLGLPVSDLSQYELIDQGSVFVSRFATGILEALASGKPVIYFNPHGEKVDKFQESLGAFDVASTEEELVTALNKVRADITARVDFRERALPFLKHHANYEPDGPSVVERVADAVSTVLSEEECAQRSTLREALEQAGAKQSYETDRESSTLVKPQLGYQQDGTRVESAGQRLIIAKEVDGPVLFLIISCVAYKERRSVLKDHYTKHLRKGDQAIFVIGGAKQTSFDHNTSVLHLAVGDAYEDLPEKVLKAIDFAHRNFEYRYLIKVDDDVVINFGLFYPALSNAEGDYFGRRVPAIRGSKPSETWHYGKVSEHSKYFNKPFKISGGPSCWASGGIYGLTKRATSEITESVTKNIDYSNYLYEDHTIATILTARAGIQPFFFCDSPLFTGYQIIQTHLGNLLDATKIRLDAQKLRSASSSVISLHCGPYPPAYKLTRGEVIDIMKQAMSEFEMLFAAPNLPPISQESESVVISVMAEDSFHHEEVSLDYFVKNVALEPSIRADAQLLGAVNDRLAGYKKADQTVTIIGNGPSLSAINLRTLRSGVTASFNRAYIVYEERNFYPTYYFCIDKAVLLNCLDDIRKLLNGPVSQFILLECEETLDLARHPKVKLISKAKDNAPYFGDVATFSVWWLVQAGYRHFDVLGCDCSYVEDIETLDVDVETNDDDPARRIVLKPRKGSVDPNHFIPNYFGEGTEYSVPREANHLKAWKAVAEFAKTNQMRIVFRTHSNASHLFHFKPFAVNTSAMALKRKSDKFTLSQRKGDFLKKRLSDGSISFKEANCLFRGGDYAAALTMYLTLHELRQLHVYADNALFAARKLGMGSLASIDELRRRMSV